MKRLKGKVQICNANNWSLAEYLHFLTKLRFSSALSGSLRTSEVLAKITEKRYEFDPRKYAQYTRLLVHMAEQSTSCT